MKSKKNIATLRPRQKKVGIAFLLWKRLGGLFALRSLRLKLYLKHFDCAFAKRYGEQSRLSVTKINLAVKAPFLPHHQFFKTFVLQLQRGFAKKTVEKYSSFFSPPTATYRQKTN
ncbi:MAG: hypothetical protein ACLQQ4_07160 [Bacteroidia bacterium]